MRRTMLLALGLVSLNACSSGRVVVASGDPAPVPPPKPAVLGPVASLGIPPGHYPPPGECRVWIPGQPPGHQPEPCSCSSLIGRVSPGAWVLYRPLDENILEVTAYDAARSNSVSSVRWYDLQSGKLIRSQKGGAKAGKHGKQKGKKG